MAGDRKADRHEPSRWHPVSARLEQPDFDALEIKRKRLKLSRRAAIIAAIRDWVARIDPED